MARFTLKNIAGLQQSFILDTIAASVAVREVLLKLGLSDDKVSRYNFVKWCDRNGIQITHFRLIRQSRVQSGLASISDGSFIEAIRKSVNMTHLCQNLGVYAAGGAYRAVRSRLTSLYRDASMIPFSPVDTRERKKPRWGTRSDHEYFVRDVLRNGSDTRERLIRLGTKKACSICGLPPVWNDIPLVLQVDHIDGDPSNNLVENLRLLCPNCHTQTPTHGNKTPRKTLGRNSISIDKCPSPPKAVVLCASCGEPTKSGTVTCVRCAQVQSRKVARPSKERLEELLTCGSSFVSVGKTFGVSDNSVRKWCTQYGLDPKKLGRASSGHSQGT